MAHQHVVNRGSTTSLLAAALTLAVVMPVAGARADDALKLEPRKGGDAKRHAAEAVQGYYEALIKKDYERAGSFVHPDFVAPLQQGLLAEVERAPTDKQKQGTFEALGVADLNAMKGLTAGQFFSRFAASRYGTTIQAIGDPALKAEVKVGEVRCNKEETACDVDIVISVFDAPTKKRNERPSTVRAQLGDGHWLVGGKPAARKPPPGPAAPPPGSVPPH